MTGIFTRIEEVVLPADLQADASGHVPGFSFTIRSNGVMPFVQAILRGNGGELILRDDAVREIEPGRHEVSVPAEKLSPGHYRIQAEGCRQADLANAGSDDWIKHFSEITIQPAPQQRIEAGENRSAPSAAGGGAKLYFCIHKHMHQPYYRTADPSYWSGENDGI